MSHDRGTALPRAQCTAVFPLELKLVRAAVALDRVAVLRAEGISERRADVVVVVANQQPAEPLETPDQFGRQRCEHGGRVGYGSRATRRGRHKTREEHETG